MLRICPSSLSVHLSILMCVSLCSFRTFPCAAVEVKNEPILGFNEGSPERAELQKVHTQSYMHTLSSNIHLHHSVYALRDLQQGHLSKR